MTDTALTNLIARFGIAPRASLAVTHAGTGYFAVTPKAPYDGSSSIAEQAQQLLEKSEARLREIGSDKSRILFVATMILDIDDLPAFNAVWDQWIAGVEPPARACFQAKLGNPALKVEQIVICATDRK